jgi:hypothetical protein
LCRGFSQSIQAIAGIVSEISDAPYSKTEVIIRKIFDLIFNVRHISEVSFDSWSFSSVRLVTQAMTYPQIYLTQSRLQPQNLSSSRLLSKNVKIIIYKTIIFPVVLYWCETWPLTLREEDRLRVFENRVLRKIFEPKGDEVIGGWRKLHNEELHNLYGIIRMISQGDEMVRACSTHGEKRNAYRILVGKPEGESPLGIPRRRWDDIKMDVREICRMWWYGLGSSGSG